MFLRPSDLVRRMGLRPGMRVIDFGSGIGHFSIALAPIVGVSGRVIALDSNSDMLSRLAHDARDHGFSNIDTVHADLEGGSFDIPHEHVDGAVMANTMFQLSDKELALRSLRKLMKPAGMLLLADWAGSFGHVGPHPHHVVTREAAQQLLEKNGFSVRTVEPAGAYHWALVAEKRVTDI